MVVVREPALELFGRNGPREQVPLTLVAPHGCQRRGRSLGLDPLGHHRETEAVAQRDHEVDHGTLVLALVHAHHERPVDLDLVQREPRQ